MKNLILTMVLSMLCSAPIVGLCKMASCPTTKDQAIQEQWYNASGNYPREPFQFIQVNIATHSLVGCLYQNLLLIANKAVKPVHEEYWNNIIGSAGTYCDESLDLCSFTY